MNVLMADNSERGKEIFGEALELGSLEEQRAFVKRACGGDETLQRAVEALLESSCEDSSAIAAIASRSLARWRRAARDFAAISRAFSGVNCGKLVSLKKRVHTSV